MHILPDKVTLSKLMKKPMSVEDQINKLNKNGIKYSDKDKAKKILLSTNYYYFTGYLYKYKDTNAQGVEVYNTRLTVEDVYTIIQRDSQLRSILLLAIDYIERDLKTKVAYYLAEDDKVNGSINYLYADYFISKVPTSKNNYDDYVKSLQKNHKDFIRFYETEYNKKVENSIFVKHHRDKYWGCLPIWVAVEIMTIGNIKHLYTKLLPSKIQNTIAQDLGLSINLLKNYLSCLNDFRNILAHNVRLFNYNISYTPQIDNRDPIPPTNLIFDYVVVLKHLISDVDFWNCTILTQLNSVLMDLDVKVSPDNWGFPLNWIDVLTKKA